MLSNASSRFSSKINVSNSFKTLLVPDSKVFFPWFETEINQISSSPEKAVVNIYKMILKILKCVTIQVCFSTNATSKLFIKSSFEKSFSHFQGFTFQSLKVKP